jgi:hypothetical protein
MRRRPWRPAIKGSPQTPACIRTEFKVTVERKLDSASHGNDRRFLEPNAVFGALQLEYSVPTIGPLPQLAFKELCQVQADMRIRADWQRRPDRNDRRQNLRCPEDGLFKKGLIRIGCEKRAPNVGGIRQLLLSLAKRFDDRVGKPGYGADTPTRTRSFLLPRHDRSSRLTISS